MNFMRDILEFLRSLVSWWFVVEPWEQAVRVRFGKHVKLFSAGVHVKIPFFDQLYVQNVRRRVIEIPLQTLTTRDMKTLTIHGSLGYKIVDVLKLHMTLHDAAGSVIQEALGKTSDYVVNHVAADCTPGKVMDNVRAELDLEKYGLGDVDFFLTGYVCDVPAIRLIQDKMESYMSGGSLSTTSRLDPAVPR